MNRKEISTKLNMIKPIRRLNWKRKQWIEKKNLKQYRESVYGKQLELLKNSARRERCFIIGNGPSLTTDDLNVLYENNEVCFASNRIYGVFDQIDWRPDFWGAQDTVVIDQIYNDLPYIIQQSQKVLLAINTHQYSQEILNHEKVLPYYVREFFGREGTVKFSDDALNGVYEGMTITYSLAQIAVYMGYKKIYFLGVDNSYKANINSAESDKINYFSGVKPVQNSVMNQPRLDISDKAYELLQKESVNSFFKVYNATRGGHLEAFPRVSFDSLFCKEERDRDIEENHY